MSYTADEARKIYLGIPNTEGVIPISRVTQIGRTAVWSDAPEYAIRVRVIPSGQALQAEDFRNIYSFTSPFSQGVAEVLVRMVHSGHMADTFRVVSDPRAMRQERNIRHITPDDLIDRLTNPSFLAADPLAAERVVERYYHADGKDSLLSIAPVVAPAILRGIGIVRQVFLQGTTEMDILSIRRDI